MREVVRELSSLETGFVECVVRAVDRDTDAPLVVSGNVAEMAFVAVGSKPSTGDWRPAEWLSTVAGRERFGVLVGPDNGGVVLAVGAYSWWARVKDHPEQPTRPIGKVTVT